jgi:tRNA pseudouridine38-40 synthase
MSERIRLTVRYDGTDFSGSQAQPGRRTVESTLKAELNSIYAADVKLVFASRTDSGVHADGNVCAFDAPREHPPASALKAMLNARLPVDLRVREAVVSDTGFHPRFDATSRLYLYRVYLGKDLPVDRARYCASYGKPVDSELLDAALAAIRGTHQFHCFSASGFEPAQSCCTVLEAEAELTGSELVIRLRANRFLRHMVCRLAAALLAVADGSLKLASLKAAIDGKMDFQLRPAPARGLTLSSVEYQK